MRYLWTLLCFALAACGGTEIRRSPPPPAPSATDFSTRENCLYRTVCQEIGKRGTDPLALDDSATTAAFVCSQPLFEKMRAHAAYYGVRSLDDETTDEQIELANYGRHAHAVAETQAQICRRPNS